MDKSMEIINLKKREDYLDQYVRLRNQYCELLLTFPVHLSETKEWLTNNDVEIRGVVQDNMLLGIVILYMNRNGEIAFFVKEPNKGIGSQMLTIIKEVAKTRNLKSIWAWVIKENKIAQRVFEKSGFYKIRTSHRTYQGVIKYGIEYQYKFL